VHIRATNTKETPQSGVGTSDIESSQSTTSCQANNAHVTPFFGVLSAAERASVYRQFAQRELAASGLQAATTERGS
jgi:hypothetical protein